MTDVYTSHDRILQYANHASKKLQKKKKVKKPIQQQDEWRNNNRAFSKNILVFPT